MVRSLGSVLILPIVAALSGKRELTLSELARAVGGRTSSVQRAIGLLVEDGVVSRDESHRTYRLIQGDRSKAFVAMARATLSFREAAAIIGRASPDVELLALDGSTLVVVFSRHADALGEGRVAADLEAFAGREGLSVRYLDHDWVRRELLAGPSLRDAMARAEVLVGDVDRTFPDRSAHGLATGTALGRVHGSLHVPSDRRLRQLARTHGVESLRMFGSAVRSDFRPDSDVDVLVRLRPGVEVTLERLASLEKDLERAFQRDVDLVREELLREDVRAGVHAEAVRIA